MSLANPDAAARIDALRAQLAAQLTERHYRRRPELEARYGAAGRVKCAQDAEYHLAYFAQAIAVGVPQLFADYIAWAASMLASRGIPEDDLRADVMELDALLADELGEAHASAQAVLGPALQRLAGCGHSEAQSQPIPQDARRYLDAALHEGPVQASRVIEALLSDGIPVPQLYTQVLQPAMYEVGRLWQANQVSVAEEHYCTAVTQRILGRLHSDAFRRKAQRPAVVVACVVGELHELGARMVCDLVELDGFETHYLGANMPPNAIVDYVIVRNARVLALSASIAPHLREVRRTLELARAEPRTRALKIIVGGGAFNRVPALWQLVGADG